MSLDSIARHFYKDDEAEVVTYGERRVLPYVLRRPARIFNRLISGNLVIAARTWTAIGAVLVLSAGIVVFANSRQGHSIVADLSARMGFTINNVVIDGTNELSKIDVLANLDLGRANSLFTFDIAKARKGLGKLAWVKDVHVKKSYPDRLVVTISEQKPYAVWQSARGLALIERDGTLIDRFDEKYSELPLLVGKGANRHGAEIVFLTGKVAALHGQVQSYVRIADRRWDLRLKSGLIVRLPDGNPAEALVELSHLQDKHQLLDRDVAVVDLRLKGRLVVALGEDAARQINEQNGADSDATRAGQTMEKNT